MSVNIPDLIWTVICFLLFMLVLNGLLIKPVLSHMDARKARVESARALYEKRQREADEAAIEAENARLEARKKAIDGQKALCARENERAKAELEAYAKELERTEKERVSALDSLAAETDGKLAASMDRMAEAFAEKLISGGQS